MLWRLSNFLIQLQLIKILNSEIAKEARTNLTLDMWTFMWAYKPQEDAPEYLELYAIKSNTSKKSTILMVLWSLRKSGL